MERDVIDKLKELDVSDFPEFDTCKTILEKGLWVLWIVKEKLGIRKLSAEQVASIVIDVKETSIDAHSITNAFNRAGDKIHVYHENDATLFEIMKAGKNFLLSKTQGFMQLYYFEPGKPFTSKRILSKDILNNLEGELKIVDPYCGERTLDILRDAPDKKIRFLTRLENLKDENKKIRFLRELGEFKREYKEMAFRDYPHIDIHDRYIISSEFLIILGHGIKDLGNKESFAILLNKNASKNIVEALIENFDRRWKQAIRI